MCIWPWSSEHDISLSTAGREAKLNMAGEVRYYRKGESSPLMVQSVQEELETAGDEKSIYEIGQVSAI